MKEKIIKSKGKLVMLSYLAKEIYPVQITGKISEVNGVGFDFIPTGYEKRSIQNIKYTNVVNIQEINKNGSTIIENIFK